jgi:hypothetical protein
MLRFLIVLVVTLWSCYSFSEEESDNITINRFSVDSSNEQNLIKQSQEQIFSLLRVAKDIQVLTNNKNQLIPLQKNYCSSIANALTKDQTKFSLPEKVEYSTTRPNSGVEFKGYDGLEAYLGTYDQGCSKPNEYFFQTLCHEGNNYCSVEPQYVQKIDFTTRVYAHNNGVILVVVPYRSNSNGMIDLRLQYYKRSAPSCVAYQASFGNSVKINNYEVKSPLTFAQFGDGILAFNYIRADQITPQNQNSLNNLTNHDLANHKSSLLVVYDLDKIGTMLTKTATGEESHKNALEMAQCYIAFKEK